MKRLLIAILGLLMVIIIAFFITKSTKKEPVVDTDTGFTRFQTEELMREIGYVQ